MSGFQQPKRLIEFFATAGFVGLIPRAPGTFGTIVAMPIAFLLAKLGPNIYLVATGLLIVFSIWISELHERNLGTHDSKQIVIDEVVGYLVAFAWLPLTWMSLVAAFVVFRIFDILKPWPISVLDHRVKGGLGVVVDDLAAGMIANVILQLVLSKTTWLGAGGGLFS
ncbi:phosphatidylglycerophosphatase A [soil metagenome]